MFGQQIPDIPRSVSEQFDASPMRPMEGRHVGWGLSNLDERLRLRAVREEVLLDESSTVAVTKSAAPLPQVESESDEHSQPQRRRHTTSPTALDAKLYMDMIMKLRDSIIETSCSPSSHRQRYHMLTFGARMASIFGLKNKLVRRSAFSPPYPPSYAIVSRPPDVPSVLAAANAASLAIPSCDKIIAEECLLYLKSFSIAAMGSPTIVTRKSSGVEPGIETSSGVEEGMLAKEDDGMVLRTIPISKLSVVAFRLRRVSDGDFMIAVVLLYRPLTEKNPSALTAVQQQPMIIFSHGNSTDLGYDVFSLAQLASRLHVNVLSYDYPEYGMSRGKLSERNLHRAFKLTYDFARHRLNIPRSMIFLYGQSVGSVPTCFAAGHPAQFPCCGIVLHSPLASGLRIMFATTRNSSSDVFDNNAQISQCPWPLLIMHGLRDTDVPCWHGCLLDRTARSYDLVSEQSRRIFKGIVEPHLREDLGDLFDGPHKTRDSLWSARIKLWLPEFADHNNIEILYKSEYFRQLKDFIAAHAGRLSFNAGPPSQPQPGNF